MTAALVQPASEPLVRLASNDSLRIEAFDDWAKAAPIVREWDSLAELVGADISMCAAFGEVWWKHYGRGRLRILSIRENAPGGQSGKLLGVLPMLIERKWIGPVAIRLAKLIGSDSTITVTLPAVETARAAEVLAQAVEHLLTNERCDGVHFGPMQGDTDAASGVRRAGESVRAVGSLSERSVGVCTRFDLAATFDEYLASLEKNERSNLRRNLNKIGRAPGGKVVVVTEPDQVGPTFEKFIDMHAVQWRAEGKLGHFGDWPRSTAFSRELVEKMAPMGRVAFVEREIEGERVCSYWCLLLGERCFWRLPARAVGEQWDQFALGRTGLVTMLQEMIARGVRHIEGGPGHYDYKLKHGATEHPLTSFMFIRNSLISRVKARCLVRLADAIHLGYYRAWRLKFSPKLKLKDRPLNGWWIRTRI